MNTNAKIEKKEINDVEFTFEVDGDKFEEGIKFAYNKIKGNYNISGFRKGKAPQKMIEQQYGVEVFYDEAFNHVLPDAYDSATKELELDVVSRPSIDIKDALRGKGVVFVAKVIIKPEVKLGEYKEVEYPDHKAELGDNDVLENLKQSQDKNARMVPVSDRAVQDGDFVTIDFEGFVDDEAFEGGKGEDFELEIGSKTFIEGFEEQLIGKNLDDEIDVNVTFPEEYASEDLASKDALFKVKLKDIKYRELPKLDDDFAQDISEFDTLDELKEDIKKKLIEEKEQALKQEKENSIVMKLVENSEIDIPDVMIENQLNNILADFENRMRMQGMELNMYLQYTGQTMEDLRNMHKGQAENFVATRLVLESIAGKEKIDVSEDELNEEIEKVSKAYNIDVKQMKSFLGEDDLAGMEIDVKVQKAFDIVLESAIPVEVKEETEEKDKTKDEEA